MIPKIIHYVWVGRNPKPKNIQKCMKTWKKNLKGYKIIEWNEDNFDVHENKYIEEAYKAKKWAFVSDYIRAKVIYEYGGIYLDSDVILLNNFNKLLNNKCFIGFETKDLPFTAVFGAEPHHPLIKKMVDYYKDRDFKFKDNGEQPVTNTVSVSQILIKNYHCKLNDKEQLLNDGIRVYPSYILCTPSKKSVSIHVFLGSWVTKDVTLRHKIMMFLRLNIRNSIEAELYHGLLKLFHRDI